MQAQNNRNIENHAKDKAKESKLTETNEKPVSSVTMPKRNKSKKGEKIDSGRCVTVLPTYLLFRQIDILADVPDVLDMQDQYHAQR